MQYEVQIFTKDRTKIIKFTDNGNQDTIHPQVDAWEEFYFAMGNVIDDKADKIQESDKTIGILQVRDISFDEVVDVMCEDLSPALTNALVEEKEVSVIDLASLAA